MRHPLLPRWAAHLMVGMWLVTAAVGVGAILAFLALTEPDQRPAPVAAWNWYVQHASP